jgi:hypothetical protein
MVWVDLSPQATTSGTDLSRTVTKPFYRDFLNLRADLTRGTIGEFAGRPSG